MKKKLLVAAIAGFVAQGAFAAYDPAETSYPNYQIAQELVSGTAAYDLITADNIEVPAGKLTFNGQTEVIRVDVEGANFKVAPTLTVRAVNTGTNEDGSDLMGAAAAGGAGTDFIIYNVFVDPTVITDAIYEDSAVIVGLKDLIVDKNATEVTIKVTNSDGDVISGTVLTLEEGLTTTFLTATDAKAAAQGSFTSFVGGNDTASLATIDAGELIVDGLSSLDPDNTNSALAEWDVSDLSVSSAKVTFGGDFSFGSWSYGNASWEADKDGVITVTGGGTYDKDSGKVTVDYYVPADAADDDDDLKIENKGTPLDTILKGQYSADLSDVKVKDTNKKVASLSEDAGSILYDTASLEIPYLTTNPTYNHKLFLTNNSGQPANYSTSFTVEDGVVATPGSKAQGVIPAGAMIMIKAVDLVSIDGGNRVSATIEVEADDIEAVSQSVNLTTYATDTYVIED